MSYKVGMNGLYHFIEMHAYQAFADRVDLFFIQCASSKTILLIEVKILSPCQARFEIEYVVHTDESGFYTVAHYPHFDNRTPRPAECTT
jgi:hypothetical protein